MPSYYSLIRARNSQFIRNTTYYIISLCPTHINFHLVFYRVAHTVQDRLYDDSISDSLQFITFLFSSASHPLIFSVLHPDEKQQNQHWLCN